MTLEAPVTEQSQPKHHMVLPSQLIKALQELLPAVCELSPAECPGVIGMLEQLKAHAWAQMVQQTAKDSTRDSHLLKMKEVAQKLNIPEGRAYELARQGKLQIIRIGRYIRMRPEALAEYEGRAPSGE
jgi:excisionase family DNA binding protein